MTVSNQQYEVIPCQSPAYIPCPPGNDVISPEFCVDTHYLQLPTLYTVLQSVLIIISVHSLTRQVHLSRKASRKRVRQQLIYGALLLLDKNYGDNLSMDLTFYKRWYTSQIMINEVQHRRHVDSYIGWTNGVSTLTSHSEPSGDRSTDWIYCGL